MSVDLFTFLTWDIRITNVKTKTVASLLEFCCSSGTSGGAQKMMPWNEKFLDNLAFMYDLRMHVIRK